MDLHLLILGAFALLFNLPCGVWRVRLRKFSALWFVAIHLSVPFIIVLKVWLLPSAWTALVTIPLAVAGQLAGGLLGQRLSDHRGSED